ncbi:MAG: amino acid decarboxylase [Clostridiales bacterium]|nr:amino acid decarboxylase [Clostridiales bacterium]MCI1962080.1 amino acid decarboxylase [Clostridiales bacterium]MCI2022522.1 amino acid decarboxylase [Clostridiales bacterium]MCI2027163.1 amino acid decarboxylase [Clostridiales bacterium]
MADSPLYNALRRHLSLGRSSFHTPGHKNAFLPKDLLSLDLTELPDTDSLYDACGPILEAEQNAAHLFGAKRTLFSTDGCTLCIQTMLHLACPEKGKVLCSRRIHRSAVNAMALLGLEPVWVKPQELLLYLQSPVQVNACYVTSPDYYGRVLDIPALAKACKEKGIPLLVDNAHGSHLAFTKPDLHPLHLGASMTADSVHKTLGVLTGGALLQIGDEQFLKNAKSAMALFGSTSPSYPIMASIDLTVKWLYEHPDAFGPVQEAIFKLKEKATSLSIPSISDDPTRLTLDASSHGYSGEELAEFLRKNGVEPEMADSRYCVLIATPWNQPEDFERVEKALELFSQLPPKEALSSDSDLPQLEELPPVVLPLREAVLSENHELLIEESVGAICAEAACPCPPGIPIVMPGELILPQAASLLKDYGFSTVKVL